MIPSTAVQKIDVTMTTRQQYQTIRSLCINFDIASAACSAHCPDIGAGPWQVGAGAAVEGHEARHGVDQREGHDRGARARGNHWGADTVHPCSGEAKHKHINRAPILVSFNICT